MVRPPVARCLAEPVFGRARRIDGNLLALKVRDLRDLAGLALRLGNDQRRGDRVPLGVARRDDLDRQALVHGIEQAWSGAAHTDIEVVGGKLGDHFGATGKCAQLDIQALLGEVAKVFGDEHRREVHDRDVADRHLLEATGRCRRRPSSGT